MKQLATSEAIPAPPGAHLPASGPVDSATLDLLEAWRLQDATDDPEQLHAAE
jgi:hypothetical protein